MPAGRRADERLGGGGGGGRCKSAAVPSKCYSKAEAAKLPPEVFQCDTGGPETPENAFDHWPV